MSHLDDPGESDALQETTAANPRGEGLAELYRETDTDRLDQRADVLGERPDVGGAFEPPERWVDAINAPGIDAEPGRQHNCVLCAQAVESTWRGEPMDAPPLSSDGIMPSDAARLLDGEFRPASYDSVAQQLRDAGPGSSAVVIAYPPYGGAEYGHAFNAVNHDGKIRLVDGQNGVVTDWPGPYAEELPSRVRALVRDPEGNEL